MMRIDKYVLAISCFVTLFGAATAMTQTYQPNTGQGGFQDLRVDNTTFYIGFFGNPNDSAAVIEQMWQKRAAEVCAAASAAFYVELAYSFEDPVLGGKDRLTSAADDWLRPVKYVYIPIFIPQSTATPVVNAPTKQASARCYKTKPDLVEPARLKRVKGE
jgi:hypothetical protein